MTIYKDVLGKDLPDQPDYLIEAMQRYYKEVRGQRIMPARASLALLDPYIRYDFDQWMRLEAANNVVQLFPVD